MTLTFAFRRLVYLQVLVGVVAFCIANANPGLLLVAGAIGALSWYVAEGPSGNPLPRWGVTGAALVAAVWLCIELFIQQIYMVTAMGHFIMWLQILLLYMQKSNREYAQLLILSMMLMVGASVLSITILFGIFLFAYCIIALLTVLLFQLKIASDTVYETAIIGAPKRALAPLPKATITRNYRRSFNKAAMIIGSLSMVLALIIFMAIPRYESNHPNSATSTTNSPAQAGFNDSINLNRRLSTSASKEPVMHFVVRHAPDLPPINNGSFLLRGTTLDQYNPDKKTWTRSIDLHRRLVTLQMENNRIEIVKQEEKGLLYTAEITLRRAGDPVLFVPQGVMSLSSDHFKFVEFNPIDQQANLGEPITGAVIYQLTWSAVNRAIPEDAYDHLLERSQPLSKKSSAENMMTLVESVFESSDSIQPLVSNNQALTDSPQATRFLADNYTGILGGDQESYDFNRTTQWKVARNVVRQFAANILQQENLITSNRESDYLAEMDKLAREEPKRVIDTISDYLQREFRYSLNNPQSAANLDPVVAFLTQHQQGHCELFASGLAAIARSLNIPARVVTGYRASEFNSIGGYFVVRRAHAHAWNEIYIGPDRGWTTYDSTPTAEVNAFARPDPSWINQVRSMYEYIEYHWIRGIVAYDQNTRQALIQEIRSAAKAAAEDENNWLAITINFFKRIPDLYRSNKLELNLIMATSVVLIIALVTFFRIILLRRKRVQSLNLKQLNPKARREMHRQITFYLTMLEILERQGHRRASWQTPLQFAQKLTQINPTRFKPVSELTDLLYAVRFGHRKLDAPLKLQIQKLLMQLER